MTPEYAKTDLLQLFMQPYVGVCMPFRVSSNIVEIVRSGEKVPGPMFQEIVQSSWPQLWRTCAQLANASRNDPTRIAYKDFSLEDSDDESEDSEYAEMLEALANPRVRRTLEDGCSCRFRMWSPLSLCAYAQRTEVVPPLVETIESVRKRFPKGFDFLKLMIVQMRFEGFGKVDISATKKLVRHDIMTLLAVDSFRDALSRQWGVEFAFRSPGMIAFCNPDLAQADFNTFLSIEDQILGLPQALLATG